jgi:hypothetical protein
VKLNVRASTKVFLRMIIIIIIIIKQGVHGLFSVPTRCCWKCCVGRWGA